MSPCRADHDAFSTGIETGDLSSVKALLKSQPELANHPDWIPPPLHCAVLWGQPEIVEVLLGKGADIEQKDPDQHTTPLRYAVMYCQTNVIPVLLDRGVNAGPIEQGGRSVYERALDCSGGAYEQFDDLPTASSYETVIRLLQEAGLARSDDTSG